MRGLVRCHTKTIQKRVKVEKFASSCVVSKNFFQKPFQNESKLKRLLRFAWSSRISYKNHSKTGQNCEGRFNLRGLLGFHMKTIHKRVKIEKVASICVVWSDFIRKPFNNESKFKRLLRFAWSGRISYKNHSKTSHNSKGCFDLRGLVRFHTKTVLKRVKIEKLLRFS